MDASLWPDVAACLMPKANLRQRGKQPVDVQAQGRAADRWGIPYNDELRITLRLCEITFREDLFRSKQAVEGGGKPGVNGHLHNDFHHFFARATDI